MADTPDKPTETPKPTTTRRRAPRKTTPSGAASTAKATVRKTANRVAAKTEKAVKATAGAAAKVERKAVRTVKPRTSSRPKPASAQRRPAAASRRETTASHAGGKWGIAAIFGGVAAAGATLAALLSLRGSSRKHPPEHPRAPDVAEGRSEKEHDAPAT